MKHLISVLLTHLKLKHTDNTNPLAFVGANLEAAHIWLEIIVKNMPTGPRQTRYMTIDITLMEIIAFIEKEYHLEQDKQQKSSEDLLKLLIAIQKASK